MSLPLIFIFRDLYEVPLYTEKTVEGKKKLDVAKNMKTMDKKNHRDRHKACGDQFHDFPR